MSSLPEQIAHHQRILICGNRRTEIFKYCETALNFYGKNFLLIDESEAMVGDDRTMVFILALDEAGKYSPHIALIDEIDDSTVEMYSDLADKIPKSGTLVYNSNNSLAKNIGEKDHTDVHKETFSGDVVEASKRLLRRIGINDERFDAAIS